MTDWPFQPEDVLRDYVDPLNPMSGAHTAPKAQVRSILRALMNAVETLLVSGGLDPDALGDLQADVDNLQADYAGLINAGDITQQLSSQLSTIVRLGTTAAPISGTPLTSTTYVFATPMALPGFVTGIEGYALQVGQLRLKRFLLSGTTFTQVGSDLVLTIGAVGYFQLKFGDFGGLKVDAGDYLGFFGGGAPVIGFTVGGNPRTPFYSNTPGGGNVSSFSDATVDSGSRFELRLTVEQPTVSEPRLATAEVTSTLAYEAARSAQIATGTVTPALLFMTRRGFWFDFSDQRQLRSDAAGTTTVTADGAPIGYARDKSGWGYHFAATGDGLRFEFKKGIVKALRSIGRVLSGRRLQGSRNDFARAAPKITIFAVARHTSPSGNQALIDYSSWPSTAVARLRHGIIGLTTGARPGVAARQSDGGGAVIAASCWIAGAGYEISETIADYVGGELRYLAGGRSTPEGYARFAGTTPTDDTDALASFLAGSSAAPFAGDLGEIIGVVGEVDDAERAGIYAYLQKMWNITLIDDQAIYDPFGPLPTIWLWFSDPRVTLIAPNVYLVGGVSPGGHVMCAIYDFTGPSLVISRHKVLYPFFNPDDHVDPALLRLPSGNILAAFTRHGIGNGEYVTMQTTTPGDIESFPASPGTNINSQINPGGADRYSYQNLILLPGRGDRIYLVFRDQNLGTGDEYWCLSWRELAGSTFAQAKRMVGPHRPYMRPFKLDDSTLGFFFNDGHPGEFPSNRTFFMKMTSDDNFRRMGGTLISPMGSLPILDFTLCDVVYDPDVEGQGRSWIYDSVSAPGTNYPVACISTYRGIGGGNLVYTDHRYHQIRWNGSAFVREEICPAGGGLIPGGPAYSGGIVTHPDNIDLVVCSRQVDGAGAISITGVHQLFKGVRTGPGAWTMTQMTFGPRPSFRPRIVPGTNKVWYCTGKPGTSTRKTYGDSYLEWDSEVGHMDIP